MDPTAAEKIVDVIGVVYDELRNSVTKVEFNDLKEVVKELAEAQKRTEIRLEQLTERVDQLAMRVDELTVNVSRLERKVEDLVGEMKGMKMTIQDIRQEIGGMSHAIGYGLEDQSYLTLPPILQRDHAITLKGRLKRGFLETGRNKYIEINIWGQGEREGKSIEIIGEAKTQLKKRDVDKFLQTIQAIQPHIDNAIHPICITYQTSPAVIHYAKEKGITLYFTYELQSG
jgi:regulator of replication initiation timing